MFTRRLPRGRCGLAFLLPLALAAAPLPAAESAPEAAPEAPAREETAAAPVEFESYQLVLLVRPADAPDYPEERLQEIQRAHIAHLTRMAEEGHIVAAGPFGDQDDPRFRGLAIYRVGSVDEARRLASADPAVAAGRLAVEVVTWYTAKGWVEFPNAVPRATSPAANEEETP